MINDGGDEWGLCGRQNVRTRSLTLCVLSVRDNCKAVLDSNLPALLQ